MRTGWKTGSMLLLAAWGCGAGDAPRSSAASALAPEVLAPSASASPSPRATDVGSLPVIATAVGDGRLGTLMEVSPDLLWTTTVRTDSTAEPKAMHCRFASDGTHASCAPLANDLAALGGSIWLVPSLDATEPMVVLMHTLDGHNLSDRAGIFSRSGKRVAPPYLVREAFLHGGLLAAVSPGERYHAHSAKGSREIGLTSTDSHRLLADEMVSWQKDAPRTLGVRTIDAEGALSAPASLGAVEVDDDSPSSCVARDGTKGVLFVSRAKQAVAFLKDADGWVRLEQIAVGATPGSRVTNLCERGRMTTTSISKSGVVQSIRCSRTGCAVAESTATVADGFSGAAMVGDQVMVFDFERFADRSERLRARVTPLAALADAKPMYPACEGAGPASSFELMPTADGALLVMARDGAPAVLCAMFVDREGKVSGVPEMR